MKKVLLLGLTLATASTSIISTTADTEFLTRQKHVLELLIGLHRNNFHNEYSEFDFNANIDKFHKPKIVKDFLTAYEQGLLPLDAVFSAFCQHTRSDTVKLFNVFYSAKDFETFYRAASWARKHLNAVQFLRAYYYALLLRDDCQRFLLPPLYEVMPNLFVPADTLHHIIDAKLLGVKEKTFTYNNTGYEYNYHDFMYGGPLSPDALGHLDYKISYLREDVGLNAWYSLSFYRFPTWLAFEKLSGKHWFRSGESLYYKYKAIFSRYILERIANGLPYVELLDWDSKIRVGYNPRLLYFNGEPFVVRPDNIVPSEMNKMGVEKAKILEKRLLDTIEFEAYWEMKNSTLVSLRNNEGIDIFGKMVFGVDGSPNRKFYGNYFMQANQVLGFISPTSTDHKYNGGALSTEITALRDPVFYQFLGKLLTYFDHHKARLARYTYSDLNFPGVTVKDFEVDKLVTYFDNFEYEVTNALPVADVAEYETFKYFARQYRLNHKPYNYKITLTSDVAKDAFVRVYIGPKHDSEEHELAIEQRRMSYYEIDRFPVKLAPGENTLKRNSNESPMFAPDPEGFRTLITRVQNALDKKEKFHHPEGHSCGMPNRLQLPRGRKNGQQFSIAVVVTQFDQKHTGDGQGLYASCGGPKLYDKKPFGFPFDRPLDDANLHDIPNILLKDILIFHEEREVNQLT